jgi:hypothetical protein
MQDDRFLIMSSELGTNQLFIHYIGCPCSVEADVSVYEAALWNESIYCHVPVLDGCDNNLDLENIQLWSEV